MRQLTPKNLSGQRHTRVVISLSPDGALRRALGEALAARMLPAGWVRDPAQDASGWGRPIALFRHPAAGEFTATLRFQQVGGWSPNDPALEVAGLVTVDFEPAYCLSPFLLDEPSYGECDVDAGDLADPPRKLRVTVSSLGEVEAAAEELTGVRDAALDYARQHANLEELLRSASADPELFEEQITRVPLLLAAAGRYDDAREAVSRYLATGEEEVTDRDYQRFVRRLTLWIDEGGVLPDPPTGPVNPATGLEDDFPSAASRVQQSRQRREAFEAVKSHSSGKSDAELRAMLRDELSRRELTEEALWVENGIDAMRRTTLGQVQATVQALGLLASTGVRLVNTFRGRPSDTPETPEWLRPPAAAAYPMKTSRHDWVTVELQTDIDDFLDSASTNAWSVANTARLEVWLSREPDPAAVGAQVTIHIGSRPVGTLTHADSLRYAPALTEAAAHQEHPFVDARLSRLDHDPHHLLEIKAPARA